MSTHDIKDAGGVIGDLRKSIASRARKIADKAKQVEAQANTSFDKADIFINEMDVALAEFERELGLVGSNFPPADAASDEPVSKDTSALGIATIPPEWTKKPE